MTLDKKIDFAIKLLRSIPQDGPIELCYSGGKDSDVILQLAKESGIPFEAIYKNTTIDPPGTIAHCREKGVTIMQPKETFFQLVERAGFPNRHNRFCCSFLKEYPIHPRAILGVRREESSKRAERYKEPEECRVYKGGTKVRHYFPILDWTLEDVTAFLSDRGIKCAPVYYDEAGNFHPERRLGCMLCPLGSHSLRDGAMQYPKLFRQALKSMKKAMDALPKSREKWGGDVYKKFYYEIFCDGKDWDKYDRTVNSPLFPEMAVDCKAFLENYFKIDLTI